MRSRLTLGETIDDFKRVFDLKHYRNARVIEKTCEALDVNEETDLHGKFYGCVQGAFFTWVVVFADGRVTHCCYDAHGEQILGDLKTQSLREILESDRMAEMQAAFERRDFSQLPRCAECFKHGGESHAFNDVLTRVQNLPGVAKDVVRKVIDVRYRG
jgi:radical SAM protein with 4Fe4S-binding SPASM domain